MQRLIMLSLCALLPLTAVAQDATPKPVEKAKKDNSKDVASVEAIMAAVYDSISGPRGQERDWDRFRNLFHKDARLIPYIEDRDGQPQARVWTPNEYILRAGPSLVKAGFVEKETHRKIERFHRLVHVWSTYEGKTATSEDKPAVKGINSFQLYFDGKRWFVMNIAWCAEDPNHRVPEEYEPKK